MEKGSKYYNFTFTINVNYIDKTVYGSFFAKDIDDVFNKLPDAILKYICGQLVENIRNINVYRKHNQVAHFWNWEEVRHSSTIA